MTNQPVTDTVTGVPQRSDSGTLRVALYARVSTLDTHQTVETQLHALREVAVRHGWKVVEIYTDNGISGAKGREKRPALDRLWKAITRREIDMVAVWSVDRLGRSLKDLVAFLEDLQAKGCGLYLHQQGLDTTTPSGRMLFGMLSVFSEFERAMIRERVRAGLARVKAEGKRLGQTPIPAEMAATVRRMRAEGKSYRTIAAAAGCGLATVHRTLNA